MASGSRPVALGVLSRLDDHVADAELGVPDTAKWARVMPHPARALCIP
jgi:hypothetical protein